MPLIDWVQHVHQQEPRHIKKTDQVPGVAHFLTRASSTITKMR